MNIANHITLLKTILLGRYYPKKLASILYRDMFNKSINWNNPSDINEKINWIAYNTDTSNWTRLADKYLVREYVQLKGYSCILTKLIGTWNNPDLINFKKFPSKFVLKCNHDAGSTIVVENKNVINENDIRNKLRLSLKSSFGVKTAEHHYLGIDRKIIAEEFIQNYDNNSDSLIDYKFWCFHAKAHYCHVVYDKKIYKNKKTEIYSLPDWIQQNNKLKNKTYYKPLPRPDKLTEMIKVAEALSSSFKQCRVDLYYNNNLMYFGELTFTAACGRINSYTDDFLIELGDKINIT